MKPVELFHLGPPKTATTWLYQCLKEHPQIITSSRDAIHYFDIHYELGNEWYDEHFSKSETQSDQCIRFDPTYSYICCPKSIDRIAKYNPNAKLIYCLRNPVERAFSHYWHIKKKIGSDRIQFSDILTHYNNYATWMEHGLLAPGMRAIKNSFSKDNVHIILYENLKKKPEEVWKSVLNFAGIDQNFRPSMLDKKVNVAGAKTKLATRLSNKGLRLTLGEEKIMKLSKSSSFIRFLSGKSEYLQGMDKDLEKMLYTLVENDIQEMEEISAYDLSHWRKN